MDGNVLFAATAASCLLVGILDRLLLRRGKVEITQLRRADSEGGYLRFVLEYHANSEPEWSELSYSFRDRKHPKTVITGKTRTISGCARGQNSEYLLIREDLLSPGEWDLSVKIITTSRRNPIYSLFPFITKRTISEVIQHG